MRLPRSGRVRLAPRWPSLLQRFAIRTAVVLVALGFALSYFLSQSVQRRALDDAAITARASLQMRLLRQLRPSDLAGPMTTRRYLAFQRFVTQSILSHDTVRVKVWNQHGTVVYADQRGLVGHTFPIEDGLQVALQGHLAKDVSDLNAAENRDDRKFGRLLEVYLPIHWHAGGPVAGAFEIYQLYAPVGSQIDGTNHELYGLIAAGMALLYIMLFGLFRSGSRTIIAQQRQLERYTRELEESYQTTIRSLAAAVDTRDESTERHSERVTDLSVALGKWLDVPLAELRDLERGALLHDIGKIGVSDAVLRKSGALTDAEWEQMRRHPHLGHSMLQGVSFLEGALPVVLHHHERWDGTGYPFGLRGHDIPVLARVFSVVDVYDALTSDRPYRVALSHDAAIMYLKQASGTQFDPAIVAAFDAMMRAERPADELAARARAPRRIRPVESAR